MDTTAPRVTRKEAAELAGVSERTVSRWAARGLLTPVRGGWRDPVEYDRDQVIRVALRPTRDLQLPEDETGT